MKIKLLGGAETMNDETIFLKREALYKMVWAEPVSDRQTVLTRWWNDLSQRVIHLTDSSFSTPLSD